MPDSGTPEWLAAPDLRAPGAIRLALRRRDSLAVAAAVAVGYLAVYLYAIGELRFDGGSGVSVVVVSDPLSTALIRTGTLSFEAVALVEVAGVSLVFSPVNTLIGAGLAVLVGLNLALSYLAVVQPTACGIDAGAGLAASLPALLTGGACCGPVLFLVVGIQASGLLLAVVAWLLPLGALLLLGSLEYVGRQVNPEALAT